VADPGTRYLIVKLAALGDVAMASTLVGAIRARDPGAHVTWLCGTRVAELVRLFDGVDEVLEVDEVSILRGGVASRLRAVTRLWSTLVRRRFDVTLLGHADTRYRLLLTPVRTGRMRAMEHLPSDGMLPIPGRYIGDEYARMLDEGPRRGPVQGHPPLADVRPRLARQTGAGVGVVLVPGGTRNVLREDVLRRWPVERYRDVAVALLAAGHPVTLVGDAGDAWVRPFFQGVGVRDEIGAHGIAGTLALLADARLVVVHDTGLLHLSRLVRAPILALFGPTIPSKSVVEQEDTVALWGGGDLACRPCYDGREFAACADNLCMQGIAVRDVLRHATAMLASPDRRAAALTSVT
jgi:heptosyltransferase-2